MTKEFLESLQASMFSQWYCASCATDEAEDRAEAEPELCENCWAIKHDIPNTFVPRKFRSMTHPEGWDEMFGFTNIHQAEDNQMSEYKMPCPFCGEMPEKPRQLYGGDWSAECYGGMHFLRICFPTKEGTYAEWDRVISALEDRIPIDPPIIL